MIPIADAHCDLPSKWLRVGSFSDNFDITPQKAMEGGLALQTVACFVNAKNVAQPRKNALAQLAMIHQIVERIPSWSLYNMHELPVPNTVHLLPALEGADCLEESTELLSVFASQGIRSVGLVWNHENSLASGATGGDGGLKPAGKKIIDALQAQHLIVDCAHMNRPSFWDTERRCNTFMVSHTACDALLSHPRNLTDDQMRCIKEHDGFLGLAFFPDFLTGKEANLQDLLKHLMHAVEIAGIEHVGLGSDFDGIGNNKIKELPNCACTQTLVSALLERGFSEEECQKLCFKNYYRFLRKALL